MPPVAAGLWLGQQHVAHDFPKSGGWPLVAIEVGVGLDSVAAGRVRAFGELAIFPHDGRHPAVAARLGPVVVIGVGEILAAGVDQVRTFVRHVGTTIGSPRSATAGLTPALMEVHDELAICVTIDCVAMVDLVTDNHSGYEAETVVVDRRVLEAASAGQFWMPYVQALVALQLHLNEAQAVERDFVGHHIVDDHGNSSLYPPNGRLNLWEFRDGNLLQVGIGCVLEAESKGA